MQKYIWRIIRLSLSGCHHFFAQKKRPWMESLEGVPQAQEQVTKNDHHGQINHRITKSWSNLLRVFQGWHNGFCRKSEVPSCMASMNFAKISSLPDVYTVDILYQYIEMILKSSKGNPTLMKNVSPFFAALGKKTIHPPVLSVFFQLRKITPQLQVSGTCVGGWWWCADAPMLTKKMEAIHHYRWWIFTF